MRTISCRICRFAETIIFYSNRYTMEHLFQQILSLSQARISTFAAGEDFRYEGAETYFKKIREEIEEAQDENKDSNQVYLEDELGDIVWDYFMLCNALIQEGKISNIENVLKRCYKKFSERIGKD